MNGISGWKLYNSSVIGHDAQFPALRNLTLLLRDNPVLCVFLPGRLWPFYRMARVDFYRLAKWSTDVVLNAHIPRITRYRSFCSPHFPRKPAPK